MKYAVKIKEGNSETGPYTLDEIKSKIASGALGNDYLVRGVGDTQWKTIEALLGESPT